jgi:hypothetical protein
VVSIAGAMTNSGDSFGGGFPENEWERGIGDETEGFGLIRDGEALL